MEYGLCPVQPTVTGDEGLFPLEYGKLLQHYVQYNKA